ncbi:MAG: hypothetical protein NT154_09215 [Verrucomicrobia bacterium]|nr:hypothetical protein [Verrucomicrobiota bacterium]
MAPWLHAATTGTAIQLRFGADGQVRLALQAINAPAYRFKLFRETNFNTARSPKRLRCAFARQLMMRSNE